MDYEPTQFQREIPERIASLLRGIVSAADCDQQAMGEASEIVPSLEKEGMIDFSRTNNSNSRFLDAAMIAENLARVNADAASEFCVNATCRAILGNGAGARANTHHGRRFSFALTEAKSGSDVSNLETTATCAGDDYVISGDKAFVTGAEWADFILVVARLDHAAKAASFPIGIFAVPRSASGLTLQILTKMAGTAYPTYRMTMREVRVASDAMTCSPSDSWGALAFGALVERLLVAASITGLAQSAWDAVASNSKNRILFGKPLAQAQTIRHRLADLATQLEAMRRLVYFAGWSLDHDADPIRSVNMAKLFAAETGQQIITECLKMSGGAAYLTNNQINEAWRQSALALFAGGVAETQREAIARRVGLGSGPV